MKRFLGLTPGQVWRLTDTGEILRLLDHDGEGSIIFEYSKDKESERIVLAEYTILEKYIEERGGALIV